MPPRSDLEGRQRDVHRPFVGENRSAPLGHKRSYAKHSQFLALQTCERQVSGNEPGPVIGPTRPGAAGCGIRLTGCLMSSLERGDCLTGTCRECSGTLGSDRRSPMSQHGPPE